MICGTSPQNIIMRDMHCYSGIVPQNAGLVTAVFTHIRLRTSLSKKSIYKNDLCCIINIISSFIHKIFLFPISCTTSVSPNIYISLEFKTVSPVLFVNPLTSGKRFLFFLCICYRMQEGWGFSLLLLFFCLFVFIVLFCFFCLFHQQSIQRCWESRTFSAVRSTSIWDGVPEGLFDLIANFVVGVERKYSWLKY